MNISKNISSIREAKGIKQYQVAEMLGIEPPNYSRLEKRGDKLTIEQLEKIASALGVTVKELVFGTIQEEKEDIQALKNRINELESIIKDKSKIVSSLEEEIESINDTLLEYWEYFVREVEYEYDFKIFHFVSDKEKKRLTIKEYLQLPAETRREIYLSNEDEVLSKADSEKIYLELVQSEKHIRAIMLMKDLGFKSEELHKIIKLYGKNDFMKVSSSIRDFTK